MPASSLDFSVGSLMAGLVFGVFGLAFLRQGKRDGNGRRALLGLTLLVYPYFVANAWVCWGIGLGLTAIPYFTGWVD